MAYILSKVGQSFNVPIHIYEADTEEDMNTIDLQSIPMGSKCHIINNGKWYMLNSNGKWKAMPKQVQPDWNQNDDTAADYVKNRPFYSETKTVTVENATDVVLDGFPVFAIGDTITVNVDGVEHSLVAYNDEGIVTIGDTLSSLDNGEGQLGWQIWVNGEVVVFSAKEAHTVSYLGIDYHHKIDPKYLPDIDNPLNITGATVSQIAKITAVDGTGNPTAWAPVDMPDALPNPNALTFTGAVTGSYDGSAPVSVEIPSGGGSGSSENWRLVNTVTTTEDVADIRITQDSDGNPLSLKKVKIFAKVRGNSAGLSTWCRITVNNLTNNFYSDIQNTFAAKEGQDYYNYARADFAIYAGRLMLELLLRSANNAASKNTLWWINNSGCFENYPDVVDAITSIRMWSSSAGIGAGTELMIYGVDA